MEERILAMIAKRRRSPEAHNDVLSLLIRARDDENHGMTDTELVGQTTILFMASFETTASALTWTLFLLAQHPAVMHELMGELDAVLGGNGPTPEQLPQLKFLSYVIQESMRVLPPVPYTVRAATRYVKMGPHTVPTGARIISLIICRTSIPSRSAFDRSVGVRSNRINTSTFRSAPDRACVSARCLRRNFSRFRSRRCCSGSDLQWFPKRGSIARSELPCSRATGCQ
jgi:hypothetical protein